MRELDTIRREAEEAAQRAWFVQTIEDRSRSDNTLSLRLVIHPGLFIQIFFGERSGSLYMALVDGKQRIFGVDREMGQWHVHPLHATEKHEALTDEYHQRPIWRFLRAVEDLILDHDLI